MDKNSWTMECFETWGCDSNQKCWEQFNLGYIKTMTLVSFFGMSTKKCANHFREKFWFSPSMSSLSPSRSPAPAFEDQPEARGESSEMHALFPTSSITLVRFPPSTFQYFCKSVLGCHASVISASFAREWSREADMKRAVWWKNIWLRVSDSKFDTVRRPLKEAFLVSKIVILDYFSRELPF